MLRATTAKTVKLPLWKFSAQCYSTPSLAERLAGAGRGQTLNNSDPFADFLTPKKNNNSNSNNKNKNKNGMMGNRNRNDSRRRNQRAPVEGQFADAEEESSNKPIIKKEMKDKRPLRKTKDRKPMRSGVKHEAVRTRRATSFIDKDIDWTALSIEDVSTSEQQQPQEQEQEQEQEQAVAVDEKEYQPYLSVGSDIQWSKIIKGDVMSTLVGSNATLDLQQKALFLSTVANATSGQPLRK
ncbi:hypothetical protein BCV72DRAFT_49984 [Rhizopus microsporus var. microsporus]|uniref:Uncharacterized protein n=2 Tax=Rhizopus microsporus TaxID=58291 RepID=A0A2G4T9F8_RHIZD|nr:uncharacterized protein RHIMIDRAFT_233075 [Rhizopus microsporus ATCC 52813]ORE11830.1 hypothetical protein BCV72DRAFT_49984 [Rhizopus microsporus var. microsporus]PHZ17649.1 hypothetical protein RHIMIDRAFT_233075 [Rhizopus microsporus ATCC 52813]